MQSIAMELLTDQSNWAVVRLPARRFPGVVVQGDSLSILCDDLRSALAALCAGDAADATSEVESVLERLEEAQRRYERTLTEHGIPLPYRPH
jgi:predicted RNase H-like HicB family nuclease